MEEFPEPWAGWPPEGWRLVRFTVPHAPVPQPRQRAGRKRSRPTRSNPFPQEKLTAYLPKGHAVTTWKDRVLLAGREARPSGWPLDGPVVLAARFTLRRPRTCKSGPPLTGADADNLAKAVLDALQGVLYHKDSQVVRLIADRRYADGDRLPGVEVAVLVRDNFS